MLTFKRVKSGSIEHVNGCIGHEKRGKMVKVVMVKVVKVSIKGFVF